MLVGEKGSGQKYAANIQQMLLEVIRVIRLKYVDNTRDPGASGRTVSVCGCACHSLNDSEAILDILWIHVMSNLEAMCRFTKTRLLLYRHA